MKSSSWSKFMMYFVVHSGSSMSALITYSRIELKTWAFAGYARLIIVWKTTICTRLSADKNCCIERDTSKFRVSWKSAIAIIEFLAI
jgi:hypothetical protein